MILLKWVALPALVIPIKKYPYILPELESNYQILSRFIRYLSRIGHFKLKINQKLPNVKNC